jgi:hypothetical protein
LFTWNIMFWKESNSLFFYDLFILIINRIPEFRFPKMDKINSWQIQVFCMPAKKCFPCSNITIGSIYTLYFILYRLSQDRIQIIHIPFFTWLIHQCVQEISSINWGWKSYILPKLTYYNIIPSLIRPKSLTHLLFCHIILLLT